MSGRLRQALPAVVGLAIFTAALIVLRDALRSMSWPQLAADMAAIPSWQLAAAAALTALNYGVLTTYDFLAFASIGKTLPAKKIAAASFLSYAISHNLGFALLSGTSVRYRFYARWGVTGEELSRIVVSYSVTFAVGLLALGGWALARLPPVGIGSVDRLSAPVGWMLMAAAAAYVIATAIRREPIRLGRLQVALPSPAIAIGQVAASSLDWALAAAVLFILLPQGSMPFEPFVVAFLAAVLLGMASHVPGGLGVFEGALAYLLKPYLPSAALVPALVMYRVVYYLLPLAVAVVVLAADELRLRRQDAARLSRFFGRVTERITPGLFAALTFFAGLVLLFSGATPAAPGRLERLAGLPLGVIELSHFLGSVIGAVLLLLSQGLSRKLDAAYYLTVGALGVGIGVSLLKGLDYEEAIVLAGVLALLLREHRAFDRRAAFFDTRFSPSWIATVAAAIGASIWLGLFAFKHVNYSQELWWQFELGAEASRSLRASVGASIVVLLFGVARMIRHAPHAVDRPDDEALAAAGRVIAGQPATFPNLVYLRDKVLLFNAERTGFVAYGVQGRTWAALGDPVGPEDCIPDLVRLFLERCDDYGGIPVFYEVSRAHLHVYADFGLAFAKLGEEARVDLRAFPPDGPHAARVRKALRRLEKDGATFEVLNPADVRAVLPELRAVSDAWLASKTASEKGFSLGFFDDEYLVRFPVAVVRRAGRIDAFANLWLGAGQVEMSIDLMRYRPDAPNSIMETLLAHLMKWGQDHGFQWFVLGMAPLSGFERSPAASVWNRIGAFVYEHGEALYNFQGLRAFKERFDPIWQPRYLVYPGGIRLPRILADVSALVAGGYGRILRP